MADKKYDMHLITNTHWNRMNQPAVSLGRLLQRIKKPLVMKIAS